MVGSAIEAHRGVVELLLEPMTETLRSSVVNPIALGVAAVVSLALITGLAARVVEATEERRPIARGLASASRLRSTCRRNSRVVDLRSPVQGSPRMRRRCDDQPMAPPIAPPASTNARGLTPVTTAASAPSAPPANPPIRKPLAASYG